MGTLYKIENIINGKCYYGQTTGKAAKRRRDHFGALRSNRHGNKHLQSSWNKYGEEVFTFTIISDSEDDRNLDTLERQLISIFKADLPEFGYNKDSGGNLQKKMSEDAKLKMSKVMKEYYKNGGTHPTKGKKLTQEAVENNRRAQKAIVNSPDYIPYWLGKAHSEDSRQKISEAQKLRYADGRPGARKGKLASEDTRKRISLGRIKYYEDNPEAKVNLGAKLTQKYADGWVSPRKGKKSSEETKSRISTSRKDFYANGGKNGMQGRTHSEASRSKMREAARKRLNKEE